MKRRRKSAKREKLIRIFLLIFILGLILYSSISFRENVCVENDKNAYISNYISILAFIISLCGLVFNINTYGTVEKIEDEIMSVITDNYTATTIDQEYIALFNCILNKKTCKKSKLLILLLTLYSILCSVTLSVLLSLYKEYFSLFNELVNFVIDNLIFVFASFLMIVSVIGFISACIYYIDKNE